MKKSGLADSPFFSTPRKTKEVSPPRPHQPPLKEKAARDQEKRDTVSPQRRDPVSPKHRDPTSPRHRDTTIPRCHDAAIEQIRKAVKEVGKEAATHRFTAQEKRAIADILYTYKGQGIQTSENEVTRIAINFIIDDYRENGENSILGRALRALND